MLSENCSLPTVRSAIAAGPRRGSARELAACSAFAATLAVFAGCSKPVPVAEDIRPVRAMTVAPARATTIAELSGEVRPRIESKLGFQVGGRITSRRVEVGQRVAVGDVLATLDAVDYKLSAAASSAQLLSAQVDRDQQRTDYRRFEDLYRQGFISAADLERRKSQLDAADAKFTQSAAQANVSGNQETYATLTAAQPGVVTGVDAEVGQVVAAGQSVIRVAQTSEKEVAIAIPENRLEALRRIEIPDDMMKKMRWKTKLGAADGPIKRKILGENSARLYRYPIKTAFESITGDQLALMKTEYRREGIERNNAYYGYVPKPGHPAVHAGNRVPFV